MFKTIYRSSRIGTRKLKLGGVKEEEFDVWFDDLEIRRQCQALIKEFIDSDRLTVISILQGGGQFGYMTGRMIQEAQSNHQFTDLVIIAKRSEDDDVPAIYHGHIRPEIEITGRDIVLVDDILDSGVTLSIVKGIIDDWKPRSLRIAVAIDKSNPLARVRPNFALFKVPPGLQDGNQDYLFCGFGMGHFGQFRYLEYVIELGDKKATLAKPTESQNAIFIDSGLK